MRKDELNYFRELLAILSYEELLRCQHRFEMRQNLPMANLLGDELDEREISETKKRQLESESF